MSTGNEHNASPALVRVDQLEDAAIGCRIAFFRKQRGWTQSELARRCEISQATMSRLEADSSSAKLGVVDRVRRELGVTYAQLTESVPVMIAINDAGNLRVREVLPNSGLLTANQQHQ